MTIIWNTIKNFHLVLKNGLVPLASPIPWNVVDDHKYSNDPFFHDHPRKIMANKEFNVVPTMIGVVKEEGLLFSAIFKSYEENLQYMK